MRKSLAILVCLPAILVVSMVVAAPPAGASGPVYDSTLSPLPGNLPSEAFEAQSAYEFGSQVSLAAAPATGWYLQSATVTMSSWQCEHGHWFNANDGVNTDYCQTTPGSTFPVPITFTVYNVGPGNSVGSAIATKTQTFNIPNRPTSDDGTNCADMTAWYSAADNKCYHGLANNITFTFPNVPISASTVIYKISFNTSHYGNPPVGEATTCYTSDAGCGYDSLNVGLSQDPTNISAGANPVPGSVYLNSSWTGAYCDGGAGGTGTFRIDPSTGSTCWGAGNDHTVSPYYIPAVQLNAAAGSLPHFTNAGGATATRGSFFTFTFTTTGVPTPALKFVTHFFPALNNKTKLPGGLTFTDNHDGTGTLAGTPKMTDTLGPKRLAFAAKNIFGLSRQLFILTIN
jgi:hypothetical protein